MLVPREEFQPREGKNEERYNYFKFLFISCNSIKYLK